MNVLLLKTADQQKFFFLKHSVVCEYSTALDSLVVTDRRVSIKQFLWCLFSQQFKKLKLMLAEQAAFRGIGLANHESFSFLRVDARLSISQIRQVLTLPVSPMAMKKRSKEAIGAVCTQVIVSYDFYYRVRESDTNPSDLKVAAGKFICFLQGVHFFSHDILTLLHVRHTLHTMHYM